MNHKSARFVGQELFLTTKQVYEIWHALGLVTKNIYSEWVLTQKGYDIGGRMSKNNYVPVPTFDFEVIKKVILDYLQNK